jgi:hypothetical protein
LLPPDSDPLLLELFLDDFLELLPPLVELLLFFVVVEELAEVPPLLEVPLEPPPLFEQDAMRATPSNATIEERMDFFIGW